MDAESLTVMWLLAVKLCPSVPLCYAMLNGMVPGMQKLEDELAAVRNGLLQCISYVRKLATSLISTRSHLFTTALTENVFESYCNILTKYM